MPDIRHLATTLGRDGTSPLDAYRLNYRWTSQAEGLTPREIVAGLHAEIAAKSPEHARLVAEFERRQAAREAR